MKEIGILHISDAQFGPHHRFGTGVESLASRLLERLRDLPTDIPDIALVIFSGDAAEAAKPSEFRMAAAFLLDVLHALDLSPERLVVVPGNHDVSWDAYRAYVHGQRAAETDPEPPFSPKWDAYLAFLDDVYGAGAAPATDEVRRFEDLALTISALNSTVAETDELHYGFCGEDQLRQHAGELAAWTGGPRVAVVHHNVRRHAEVESENLRDESDFTAVIGPHVDLVLHGHTHNGKRDYLSDGTLVLSTGSAALKTRHRPEEVPNQFQVIGLGPGTIRRWAFSYFPGGKRWVLDSTVGESGTPGYEEIDFDTLPPTTRSEGSPGLASEAPERDDPLSRVADRQEISERAVQAFRDDLREDAASVRWPGLTAKEVLARLGLMSGDRPTRAGILLFGTEPQLELPGAVIQCVHYRGSDRTADRESTAVTGTARDQVDGALEFLRVRVPRRERPGTASAQAEVTYRYPMRCLREVVVNAVVHRNYGDAHRNIHVRLFEDRIEVASPGAWCGGRPLETVTPLRSLASESIKRNPVVARVMSLIRYFEGEGSGVPTAVRDSDAIGAAEPTVTIVDGFTIVTVYPSDLDEGVAEILLQDAIRAERADRIWPLQGLSEAYIEQSIEYAGGKRMLGSPQHIVESPARRIVVVGAAGAGKSTLLRHLAARLGRSRYSVPILVRARDLLPRPGRDFRILHLLADELRRRQVAVDSTAVKTLLDSKDVTLLVDGLDEISVPETRERLIKLLNDFVDRWPRHRVIAATRKPGLSGLADPLAGWTHAELSMWSLDEFEKYVRAIWPAEHGEIYANALITTVQDSPWLGQFARNPLLATMLINVFRERQLLPHARTELYEAALDALLNDWDAARGIISPFLDRHRGREILGHIALSAFEERRPLSELPRSWCLGVVRDHLQAEHPPEEFLERVLARGSILTERGARPDGEPVLGFTSLAFGEVLAAEAALLRSRSDEQLAEFITRAVASPSGQAIAEVAISLARRRRHSVIIPQVVARAGERPPSERSAVLEVVAAAVRENDASVLERAAFYSARDALASQLPASERVRLAALTPRADKDSHTHGVVTPVYFVVDVSSSMEGRALEDVTEGLRAVTSALGSRSPSVWVSLVTFSETARILMSLRPGAEAAIPPLASSSGSTAYGPAIALVRACVEEDLSALNDYGMCVNRPLVFFLTDGAPVDSGWPHELARLASLATPPRIIALGLGDVNAGVLSAIGGDFAFRVAGDHGPSSVLRGLAGWIYWLARPSARDPESSRVPPGLTRA